MIGHLKTLKIASFLELVPEISRKHAIIYLLRYNHRAVLYMSHVDKTVNIIKFLLAITPVKAYL